MTIEYTQELTDKIADMIACGKSLRQIGATEGMPSVDTLFRWLRQRDDFASICARARVAQAEFHHDEMQKIEDDVMSGAAEAQAASVVLGNKRWRMERMSPKVYGAKLGVDMTASVHVNRVSFADNDTEHKA